jgi:hypothetical protein
MPITNLASHNLVKDMLQNSFICNSYVSRIDTMHWNIFDTDLKEDMKFV